MSIAYYTLYFALTDGGAPLTDETLSAIGSKAWVAVDDKMDNWPERMATVKDHDMDFQVEVLELCEDDTGVEFDKASKALSYGIGFYTEQHGLTLEPRHLQQVQSFCLDAFRSAAQDAGLSDVDVQLLKVEASVPTETHVKRIASSLEALAAVQDESYWVGSNGDTPDKLFFSRETAFASGSTYIDAFDKGGTPLRCYKMGNLEADEEARGSYSEADYTTDF